MLLQPEPVSGDDDEPGEFDEAGDFDEHPEDIDELDELTAEIGTILAGVTVVPAAIMWWRTRRERRAGKDATSP